MSDRRISIVGCSGSGKSTLARRLKHALGLPRLELDGVYHQKNWIPLPDDRFRRRVAAFMDEHSSWVIDGNYGVVRPDIWTSADTVIWLHPPRRTAMWRVGWRSIGRSLRRTELWNRNRESLGSLFSLDPERSMLAWTWTTHPAKEVIFERRFAEPQWSHLDRRRFARNIEVDSWLASLQRETGTRPVSPMATAGSDSNR
jgi:adenylate kinase family enzyme